MLCLTDNVKEIQVKLSKRMNNSKRNLEAFNVKIVNMPGKLGANMAIYNSKVEQCSNQTNQVECMIIALQKKFDILMVKVTNLEEKCYRKESENK
jgi:hypothetical protein